MPYRNKQMLRDANGDLIPQYWDVAAGDFKPLTGSDGANDTRVTGSNVELEVYKGVDLSGMIAASFKKQQGASRAILEYVLDRKDENEAGRISIVNLNRLTGSRYSTFELRASSIRESGRVLFFWEFDNIDVDIKNEDILQTLTSNIPPINEFAQILTISGDGIFDVTLNVSYFT